MGRKSNTRSRSSFKVEQLEQRLVYAAAAATVAEAVIGVYTGPMRGIRASAVTVPTVVSTSPNNGQNSVATNVEIVIKFSTDMLASSMTSSSISLRDPQYNLVSTTVTYDATTMSAKIRPTVALTTSNKPYTVVIAGGSTGVKDTANTPVSGYGFTFFTGKPVFVETTAISGLTEPTAVKFAPDGRIFVAEKSGIIKLFTSLTDTSPSVLLDLREEVHNFWDRGLLGLTVHPNLAANPYVYALYTYDGDLGGPPSKFGNGNATTDPGPDATGQGAKVSCKLVRYTLDGNTIVAGSEKLLVADWQNQFPSHSIGTVEFGPDGYLYVSAGDGASFGAIDRGQFGNPFNDPENEGGALRPQDLLSTNDPTTLDGSVIRIDAETGLAAPNNPLSASSDANARRIIAHGLRNPFRMTFRPGSNEAWIGDVGWNEYEEINRIVATGDSIVENFGWPAYEGRLTNYGYQNANLPLLQPLFADPSKVTMPYLAYKHDSKVVAGSSEPIGGSSISGLAFYTGGGYGAGYQGALFFADYSRKQIYVMYKGPDGLPVNGSQQIFKATQAGPTQLITGPNGDLFYVDMNGGRIQRFVYTDGSANNPPVAIITADKTSGPAPLTVRFDSGRSSDPDVGDSVTLDWDLDGDGEFDDAVGRSNPQFTYDTPGSKTATLRVTDAKGLSSTASIVINVGNTAPDVTVSTPLSTLKWAVGDTINFAATATDLQDGTLPASAFKWTLTLLHDNLSNPENAHTHHIQTFEGVKSGSFVAPEHEYPSRLQLTLVVTDSAGETTTKNIVLAPQTAELSFNSAPAGMQVTVNGAVYTTPFNYTVIAGAATTVSAATNQFLNGNNYAFATWSDGGARSHEVVATSNRTISVNYNQLNPQGPYGGTPASVPGKIETENFDTGGANVAYTDTTTGNEGGAYRPSEDVDIEATQDTGGGFNVGWLVAGERLSYTIDVTTAGTYTLDTRLATIATGGQFHLEVDNVDVTGLINAPNTGGFQNWANVSKGGIALTAGRHVLKFVVDRVSAAGILGNVNHFTLTLGGGATTAPATPTNPVATPLSSSAVRLTWTDAATNESGYKIERRKGSTGTWEQIALLGANATNYDDAALQASTQYQYRLRSTNAVGDSAYSVTAVATTQAPPARSPFGGVAEVVPGTVQIENFDIGGQGVAYNDLSDGNEGGQYRAVEEDVDVESTSDVGGGFNVGWFLAGEWMEYTINVATTGTYTLDLRIASPGAGAKVNFTLDGSAWSGDLAVPNTGGFQNWQTMSKTALNLTAGTHVIRLTGMANSDFGVVGNVNWFKLTNTSTPPPASGGDGLTGTYYNNSDFTGTSVTRVDPSVNFNWGSGSPDGSLGADTFSVRWTGQILADKSETYAFYTKSDDGARLWVNGQLIIDRWRTQSDTEWSGTIALQAGQKYSIKLEYFDDKYAASVALRWSSATTAKQIIPQSNLFSGSGVQASSLARPVSNSSSIAPAGTSRFVTWTFTGNAFASDVEGPIRAIDLIDA